MGIQGLIPFLEKATRKVNISQFAGCSVAIDAYCWLHKGAYSCVEKLARGEPCDAYVHYCMKFVNMLLSYNIKPILVFDGQHLPAKAATEKKRRESRQSSRKRAAELLRAGRTAEARNFLSRCIDVTHDMALALMNECRRRNVDCLVAPYEADAQLAYLNIKNIAQIVITEDSDLVLFGCTKIMFKMDLAGNGLLVEQERLHLAMGVRPENFSFDKFRYMCILSGCDYLPSLPGIGLNKACKFVTRTADTDIHRAISRLPGHLNMRSLTVPEEYRDEFMLADATFRYQIVFDPISRKLVRLAEPPDPDNVTENAGAMLPANTAYQLALGNLNPFTLEKVDDYNPDAAPQFQSVKTDKWNQVSMAPHPSIWSQNYQALKPKRKPEPLNILRPSTKGKVVQKEVKLLSRIQKEEEPAEEQVTNVELTTLYTDADSEAPPTKRKRTDSCDFEDIEIGKENSPVSTPTKQKPDSLQESVLTSPVLGTTKSRRNPFQKQSGSPNKCTIDSSPSLLGLRENAFSKVGKLRRTEIDENVIVQSRFFTKVSGYPKNTDSSLEAQAEISTVMKKNETLKDVSNTSNKSDISSPLDLEICHSHSPTEPLPILKSNSSFLSAVENSASKDQYTSPEKKNSEKQSDSGFFTSSYSTLGSTSETKGSSESGGAKSSKPLSKSFSWCQNKFSFQKAKSIAKLETSSTAVRDFRNPFRKVVSSSDVSEGSSYSTLNSKSKCVVLQENTATPSQNDIPSSNRSIDSSEEFNVTSISLSVEEEDEELADDPSPIDSDASSRQQKMSVSLCEETVAVDEGFHSPSSSRFIQLRKNLSLSVGAKSKGKSCRRLGLSKNSVGKQQSLLNMFGFQKKPQVKFGVAGTH